MKKIVFYGDGMLWPPEGYGESLIDLLVLRQPTAAFQSFHPGEEALTLEAALKGAPLHVIGKAPDWTCLSVGSADLLADIHPAAALAGLDALLQLLTLKTRSTVFFASPCAAFFPEEKRDRVLEFNAGLPALAGPRARFLDLDEPTRAFLEKHRQGAGEKRALHQGPLRLTSMGRVFLSHAVFERLPWDSLFSG